MRKRVTAMLWLSGILLLFLIASCSSLYPRVGKVPKGERLERIKNSPNYVDGEFQNLVPTPMFVPNKDERDGFFSGLINFLFGSKDDLLPDSDIPVIKADLKGLNPDDDIVIWFGHSSYYIQLNGKRILIDPVFSDYGSPFPFINQAFDGTSIYSAADTPPIDYLLITHDHWDHLDYQSVKKLRSKISVVICGLGVGSHFEHWGFDPSKIIEADWYDTPVLNETISIHLVPSRHFAGRLLDRNKTLWTGFVLEAKGKRLLISGDGGYGPHFKEIGKRFGAFDLAILECGQYNKRWANIHMTPEESAKAALNLNASAVLPSHNSRFILSDHTWDNPLIRVKQASANQPFNLLTPKIGEVVNLNDWNQRFESWWEN